MKYTFIILFCFSILHLISCKNIIKDNAPNTEEIFATDTSFESSEIVTNITNNTSINSINDLYGFWVGMFEPNSKKYENKRITTGEIMAYDYINKITISIDSINNYNVFGHSIVAGNIRPFSGSYSLHNNTYVFNLKEPGDDKYDGTFNFQIGKNDTSIVGTWNAFKNIEIAERKYVLIKKLFTYNPENKLNSVYIDWNKSKKTNYVNEDEGYDREYFSTTEKVYDINASTQKLTTKDIENLTKADLYILRNTIYAKHGYSFKNRQLRTFFDKQDWYMPVNVNIKNDLTPLEKENIKLLLRYEKNAAEYYDEFGRG